MKNPPTGCFYCFCEANPFHEWAEIAIHQAFSKYLYLHIMRNTQLAPGMTVCEMHLDAFKCEQGLDSPEKIYRLQIHKLASTSVEKEMLKASMRKQDD